MLRTTYAFIHFAVKSQFIISYPILSYPQKFKYAPKYVNASETQLYRLEDKFYHHHLIVPA